MPDTRIKLMNASMSRRSVSTPDYFGLEHYVTKDNSHQKNKARMWLYNDFKGIVRMNMEGYGDES